MDYLWGDVSGFQENSARFRPMLGKSGIQYIDGRAKSFVESLQACREHIDHKLDAMFDQNQTERLHRALRTHLQMEFPNCKVAISDEYSLQLLKDLYAVWTCCVWLHCDRKQPLRNILATVENRPELFRSYWTERDFVDFVRFLSNDTWDKNASITEVGALFIQTEIYSRQIEGCAVNLSIKRVPGMHSGDDMSRRHSSLRLLPVDGAFRQGLTNAFRWAKSRYNQQFAELDSMAPEADSVNLEWKLTPMKAHSLPAIEGGSCAAAFAIAGYLSLQGEESRPGVFLVGGIDDALQLTGVGGLTEKLKVVPQDGIVIGPNAKLFETVLGLETEEYNDCLSAIKNLGSRYRAVDSLDAMLHDYLSLGSKRRAARLSMRSTYGNYSLIGESDKPDREFVMFTGNADEDEANCCIDLRIQTAMADKSDTETSGELGVNLETEDEPDGANFNFRSDAVSMHRFLDDVILAEHQNADGQSFYPGAVHVVVGAPGTGKSTLLKYLVWQCTKSDGAPRGRFSPIFVPLREWELAGESLDVFLAKRHSPATNEQDASFADRNDWDKWLRSEDLLLCLDGIDEVGDALLARVVETLRAMNPQAKAVISCRHGRINRLLTPNLVGVPRYVIRSVNAAERDRFVRALFGKQQADRAAGDGLIARFGSADADELRNMARNPLLLTILCQIAKQNGDGAELPTYRTVVYQRAVDILLKPKRVDSSAKPGVAACWFGATTSLSDGKIAAIEWMALRLLCLQERGEDLKRKNSLSLVFSYREAAHIIANYLGKNGYGDEANKHAETLLEYVCERTNLLDRVGAESLTFRHPTVHEFLAACALKRMAERTDIAFARLNPTRRLPNHDFPQILARVKSSFLTQTAVSSKLDQLVAFLDHRSWDPRWHLVFVFLAGLLDYPQPLIKLLIEPTRQDTFCFRSELAIRCLAEIDFNKTISEPLLPIFE